MAAISATQYVFLATTLTATTVATSIGGYTVASGTRSQLVAISVVNTATTDATAYCDVSIYNGSFSTPVGGTKVPVYPGGAFEVLGVDKHVMPTSGAVQVTPYATTGLAVAVTLVELT